MRIRITTRVVAALVLCVLASLAVVDVLTWRQAARAQEAASAGEQALDEAGERVPHLLTYSWSSLAEDFARANRMTTGAFHDEYAQVLDEVVAAPARKQKIVTRVAVDHAGLVSSAEDEAVVLVFLTQTTRRKGSSGPVVSGSRVEVTMRHVAGEWLIAGLEPL